MKRIIKSLVLLSLLTILVSCGEKTFTGKLEYSAKPQDEMFNVEVDAPILIRTVEMVQYYKNDNGEVIKVFSNEPIESFDNYVNPEFNNEIISEVFFNDISIDGIMLSEDLVKAIAYSENTIKKELKDLPEDELNKYNLVLVDGVYATANNDWEIGDLRISYSYVDKDDVYNISGKLKDDVLEITSSSKITKAE